MSNDSVTTSQRKKPFITIILDSSTYKGLYLGDTCPDLWLLTAEALKLFYFAFLTVYKQKKTTKPTFCHLTPYTGTGAL